MRVVVTGTRNVFTPEQADWVDKLRATSTPDVVEAEIGKVLEPLRQRIAQDLCSIGATEIVAGCAEGVDQCVHDIGQYIFPFVVKKPFVADWDRFGPAAGPIRNGQMIDWLVGDPDGVVVAYPHGRRSRGTWDCVAKAHAARRKAYISNYFARQNTWAFTV